MRREGEGAGDHGHGYWIRTLELDREDTRSWLGERARAQNEAAERCAPSTMPSLVAVMRGTMGKEGWGRWHGTTSTDKEPRGWPESAVRAEEDYLAPSLARTVMGAVRNLARRHRDERFFSVDGACALKHQPSDLSGERLAAGRDPGGWANFSWSAQAEGRASVVASKGGKARVTRPGRQDGSLLMIGVRCRTKDKIKGAAYPWRRNGEKEVTAKLEKFVIRGPRQGWPFSGGQVPAIETEHGPPAEKFRAEDVSGLVL